MSNDQQDSRDVDGDPGQDEMLPPEVLRLEEKLLADGAAWRRQAPAIEAVNERVRAIPATARPMRIATPYAATLGDLPERPAPIRSHHRARTVWAFLSVAVVTALLGGLIMWSESPPAQNTAVGNGSVTVDGITVTVTGSYADATRTLVTYKVSATGQQTSGPDAFPVLSDASGHRYAAFNGGVGFSPSASTGEFEFVPLPSDQLGKPQTLILSIHTFTSPGFNGRPIYGPWRVRFHVTPAVGSSPPVGQQTALAGGITIQLEHVDIAPNAVPADGIPGGVRALLRLSGLPSDAALLNIVKFNSQIVSETNPGPNDSSISLGPGIMNGQALTLTTADGTTFSPAVVLPLVNHEAETFTDPATFSLVVGPTRTVEIEVLFSGTFSTSTTADARLTIAGIDVTPPNFPPNSTNSSIPQRVIMGPWTFALPVAGV